MAQLHWIILTGEYPPQNGGVSDYTHLVAKGLADAGDQVQVWAPSLGSRSNTNDSGIALHRLPDHFGMRGLAELTRVFSRLPADARVLVQYVPHAFGYKAMNLLFCLWLLRQHRSRNITIMFHEVAFPWLKSGRLFHLNLLAVVNRIMAFLLVRSASRLCVSIPGWARMLRKFAGTRTLEWIPVPSTMPLVADCRRVQELRNDLLAYPKDHLVGHFGTFGGSIKDALSRIVPQILTLNENVVVLLVGRGAAEFVSKLESIYPQGVNRIIAAGPLKPSTVSEYLAACDLLIQPYPDGISSRRTTAMAGLACGVPIVTNSGFLTEPLWEKSGAVCLVKSFSDMAGSVTSLLSDQSKLARLRTSAVTLYQDKFCLDRTVAALRYAERSCIL